MAIPALLAFALAGSWFHFRKAPGEWVRVSMKRIELSAEVRGQLEAIRSRFLTPPHIPNTWVLKLAMMAPDGKLVSKGDPVLSFDGTDLRQRLEEDSSERDRAKSELDRKRAELAVKEADAKLDLAKAEADLRKTDMKLKVPSDLQGGIERRKAELDREAALAGLLDTKARLRAMRRAAAEEITVITGRYERAMASVDRLKKNMQALTVLAPDNGTVMHLMNRHDNPFKIGDNIWQGLAILEIPDLTEMKAVGEVDEVDAGKIKIGQKVRFHLDTYPDHLYGGTISRIGATVIPRSEKDPRRIIKVDIAIAVTDSERMRPKMRFRGTIRIARIPKVPVIPQDAVLLDPEGPAVVTKTTLGRDRRRVSLGRSSGGLVELLSGLDVGDLVFVGSEPSR